VNTQNCVCARRTADRRRWFDAPLRRRSHHIEPFELRAKPCYDLVIDRLAYWY
jgi:hypothetical protein